MNNIKALQSLNERELQTKGDASWHDDYKDSAYVYVGGLSYDMTEGDVLTVLSQFGDLEDVELIRDKDSGKSKGFCFAKYEDARSAVLAVDNFNGISLLGRLLRVDHCRNFRGRKAKKDDDEYAAQLVEMEERKLKALFEEPFEETSRETRDETLTGDNVDPWLRKRIAEKQVEKTQQQQQEEMILLAKKFGIDTEDPMRDYLVEAQLKKLRKEERRKLKQVDEDRREHVSRHADRDGEAFSQHGERDGARESRSRYSDRDRYDRDGDRQGVGRSSHYDDRGSSYRDRSRSPRRAHQSRRRD